MMVLLIIHSTKNYGKHDDKVEYIEHLFAEQNRTGQDAFIKRAG